MQTHSKLKQSQDNKSQLMSFLACILILLASFHALLGVFTNTKKSLAYAKVLKHSVFLQTLDATKHLDEIVRDSRSDKDSETSDRASVFYLKGLFAYKDLANLTKTSSVRTFVFGSFDCNPFYIRGPPQT